jgi:hypothetical protein
MFGAAVSVVALAALLKTAGDKEMSASGGGLN